MAIVKYQQKIHKAFAETLVAERKRELEEALADKPELLKGVSFNSPEVDAVLADNPALCEYFAVKSEEGEGLEFSSERTKSVKQTVKANLAYYKNVCAFIEQEDVEEYKAAYTAIKKQLDKYFEIAAEDILEDVYGDAYAELKARITAEEEEAQAKRLASRNENKAKENAE